MFERCNRRGGTAHRDHAYVCRERPWDTRRKFKNWWVGDPGEVTPTRRPFKSVIVRILPSIAGATTSDKVGLEYITRKQRTSRPSAATWIACVSPPGATSTLPPSRAS